MRIWLAVRAFFGVLFSRAVAEGVRQVLEQLHQQRREAGTRAGREQQEQTVAVSRPETKSILEAPPGAATTLQRKPATKPSAQPISGGRSEALTLLAALQREARLVDLVQEPLDQYTDAQIGAAAREVLRNAAKTLQRFFGLRPVVQAEEGALIELPSGFDPNRYRLLGQLSGNPPYRGQLVHPGWEATRCELPSWTGSEAAAWIIAPAEVEIISQ
ncbi:MAG: DUF2760 domain-containing protein [Thermoguttaceae bacterium]|nr:DUF2760 domain-containing protein [Thermoguttaceae bacterium]MDW8039580.1 DUF2760 domain-containing protein [Thermoguttaceae bacterium]